MVLHDIAVPVGAQGAIGADSTRTYCSAKHTTPCVVLDPLCAGCERRYVTTAAHGARVFDQPQCLHRPEVYAGIGEQRAADMLQGFFRQRR